jgi:hypothetical protein
VCPFYFIYLFIFSPTRFFIPTDLEDSLEQRAKKLLLLLLMLLLLLLFAGR